MAISPSPSTLKPPVYGRDLARLILVRCKAHDFAPAGRLPNERRLAAEFGVTRTLVRHALTVLEAEGRVSREVGRGTFLRESSAGTRLAEDRAAHRAAEVGPGDVMAARRLIEPRVLPLVVAWATQRDFDELNRCLEGGAGAENAAQFEVWDFALHHAIVAASRNPLLLAMYDVVEQARKGEIWGNLKQRNDSRERRAAYQADHVQLVDALCARDAEEATRVMESHLARVETHLLKAATQSSADHR